MLPLFEQSFCKTPEYGLLLKNTTINLSSYSLKLA